MVDLASSRYGGEVVWCSDEFFAASSNLVNPAAPVWREGEFTEHGKWMDGWETRRRRDEGHDTCVIRLGLPGRIRSVVVDTSHFTGNYPESFSLEACGVDEERLEEAEWQEIIQRTPLDGNSQTAFEVSDPHRVTHVRLHIYPDGGVARLRLEGDPIPSREDVCPETAQVDLAVATLGGECVEASDAHFSSPANLVSPTDPEGMWDGWETARRRGPGNDWAIVTLGLAGEVSAVDVDTRFFKGNSPGWVQVEAETEEGWEPVCERVPVAAHDVNRVDFPRPVVCERLRLNIYPDGGVARLRVWGRPLPDAAAAVRIRYLNSLFPTQAREFFETACGSKRWVEAMVDHRPFDHADDVLRRAREVFADLSREDWLEAFAAHPRIGERKGRQGRQGESMSRSEQSGVDSEDRALSDRLAEANRLYEERFGYTYIVRAAGRTGPEMLELAERRLANDPDQELEMAASQQTEITELRLRRMLCL